MHVILAAGTTPAFFAEVAALLVSSALVAYLGHRLRIMPIVSFLLTGALIGPHALGLVRNEVLIEAVAEVGVVLLLFTIGLEFSLAKLARIKRLIFVGGGLQVGLVVTIVAGALAAFGVDWRSAVFTGCLVALSSTAIVMKLLMDRGETNTEEGQAALGILIFQDLAVVAMVLLVPILGGESASSWSLVLALAKAAAIVALVIVVARRLMPKVLEAVARTCSQEIFVLTVVAVCFGTAFLTSLAGVSLSLGAFLAGLMVSESRFSELAFGDIQPLQILFSAAFFVSVGLLLDLGFLVEHPVLVSGVIASVLLVKFLTTSFSLRVLGYATGTTAFTGLLLAQVGEFSFVLERTGRAAGLFPAGLEDGAPQAFVAATAILMIATPFLARFGETVRERLSRRRKAPVSTAPDETPEGPERPLLQRHVIIAGYGEAGRRLARVLEARGIPFEILTLSPEGAREAESDNLRVLRGNYARRNELALAGARHARLLVVADDDLETTRRVVSVAHALNPDLRILARTRFESEIESLQEAGATDVIAEEQESVLRLLEDVLEAYDVDPESIRVAQRAFRTSSQVAAPVSVATPAAPFPSQPDDSTTMIELNRKQQQSTRCAHVEKARAVTPSAEGCEECLRMGDTWVHLRVCMTCGHVGCCDSSKNKHARKHFQETGHPIIKSFEPGEDWAWCYEDKTFL